MSKHTAPGKKPFFGIAVDYRSDCAVSVSWLLQNRGEQPSDRRIHAVLLMAGDELGSTNTPVMVAYGYTSSGIEVIESCYVHDAVDHDLRIAGVSSITITHPGHSFEVPLVITVKRKTGSRR